MAIKTLHFSFAIPMTQLLGLIATGDVGMKIDAVEDDRTSKSRKQLNGQAPKLLAAPAKPHGNAGKGGPRQRGMDENGKPMTAYNVMLRTMAADPHHTGRLTDLRPAVAKLGLSPTTANSQCFILLKKGHALKVSEGVYRLTAAGLRECMKLGFNTVGKEKKKATKETLRKKLSQKKKPKPEPEPVKEEVREEVANG